MDFFIRILFVSQTSCLQKAAAFCVREKLYYEPVAAIDRHLLVKRSIRINILDTAWPFSDDYTIFPTYSTFNSELNYLCTSHYEVGRRGWSAEQNATMIGYDQSGTQPISCGICIHPSHCVILCLCDLFEVILRFCSSAMMSTCTDALWLLSWARSEDS